MSDEAKIRGDGWRVSLTLHRTVPELPMDVSPGRVSAVDPQPYVDFTIMHDGVPVLTITRGVTTMHAPGVRGFGEALDRLNRLEQVGFVRWDGDEYHGFIYGHRNEAVPEGFLPVFVASQDEDGSA